MTIQLISKNQEGVCALENTVHKKNDFSQICASQK